MTVRRIYWKVEPKRVIALVFENLIKPREFLSSTGHVKPRVNLRRPRRKAKYYVSTDSELVP